MDSNYSNFPAQNYKTTARKKAGLQHRRFHGDNASPSYAAVSPTGKSQAVRPLVKDFITMRRQQFFCYPNPSESRMDGSDFPSGGGETRRGNAHLPVLNDNQKYRAASTNANNSAFEDILDENSLYENLDVYWGQKHFQVYAQNTITYTTPSELFVSQDRRRTLSKDTTKTSDSSGPRPPPLPAKFRRERFAVRMSGGVSDVDSNSTCSQELSSISYDSDTFSTQDSTSSVDSAAKIYVNLADLHSSTTPTKTLQGVSEALMASQGMVPESKSPDDPRPPPLPKKTLNRTNSAPGGVLLGSSLNKSLPCSPGFQITNPLYGIYEGKNMFWTKTSFSTPCSPLRADEKFNLSSPLNRRAGMTRAQSLDVNPSNNPQIDIEKLNFETSDLDLKNWINTDSQEEVFRTLANRCTMSLRSIAAKYSRLFLRDKEPALSLSESDWSDFQLPFDKPCCVSRDAVYYRAQYMQDEFTLKISKTLNQESLEKEPDGLSVQESLPVHFNVQQVRGHFTAALPTNLSPTEEAVLCADVSETEVSDVETGAAAETVEANTESQLDKRRQFVTIMQETPFQTMADFVNESASLHASQSEVYERQISLLLLQLCLGLEHLKNQGVVHCDLRLENLLLVKMPSQVADPGSQAQGDNLQLPRLVISNFSKAKQRNTAVDQKLHPDLARQAPEMMSTSQYKMVDEFQLGILIYEVLHMPNPFESIPTQSKGEEYSISDLPLICPLSAYSEGLQQLAHLLLRADPCKRICIRQAKSILQALLWGPCSKAFSVKTGLRDSPHVLKNWLDVKRVLLALKFGEWFLDEQSQTTLEDWLCCQYFAFAIPESMFQAVEKMQILLEEKC